MTLEENIDQIMVNAKNAFTIYKKSSKKDRAQFLENLADALESQRTELVPLAMEESHLPEGRLQGELSRTTNQLKAFAALLKEGSWVEASIDQAKPDRKPLAKADIRKMLQPVGPVVVFGASNFPFAFSTAGGDSASVLASGSTLVIKAHPGHPKLSDKVFAILDSAVISSGMPEFTIQHVTDTSFDAGKLLVQHTVTAGVGFTGSQKGGLALVEYAKARKNPIPVFAEMGSINPVVLFSDKLAQDPTALAKQYAGSITVGMGQFCTNPGLILAVKSSSLDTFLAVLKDEIAKVLPQKMLHAGIQKAYNTGLNRILEKSDVSIVGKADTEAVDIEGYPTVVKTEGKTFLQKEYLQEELFGPYSIVVEVEDLSELETILASLGGQLTTTLMATEKDLADYPNIIDLQTSLAGRVIINDVPTGVEVCSSMIHGGPFPATTDVRYTSVGTTAIKRWVRPICYQGFPENFLPDELKAANPLKIWRLVDDNWTNESQN
ncbi:aldehyde dehydrogenase (NADP(+)) [Rhizosphaericola mali]|uniref:Aldehyde dehydrogenase (NADP(+)) n=1 Tax=Rhizosphaericola mali TaxID=2545455 RepID=A0A5P2G5Y9_9BACT|nr:aldehyde dehydrogenase (NADP(+)) [Rhizosphaericola mali]QES89140.1 aldehyde dehydrogenase (NADP(+)) [Rhizosphaericola mali]